MSAPTEALLPRRRDRLLLGSAIGALLLVLLIGVAITVLGQPLAVDQAVLEALVPLRVEPWISGALVLNALGGGVIAVWVIPIAGALVFVVLKRPQAALYWILALAISAGLVQGIKRIFDRVRPEDMFIVLDSHSYPSGHTANAATMAVILALLFHRRWLWWFAALWTVAMAFSRTLLGVHWLSDTVGGALLGAAVAILLWLLLPGLRQEERERPWGVRAPPEGASGTAVSGAGRNSVAD